MIDTYMDMAEAQEFFDALKVVPGVAMVEAAKIAEWAQRSALRMATRTTDGWSTPRPKFESEIDVTWGDMFQLTLWTEDPRWNWVDLGTKGPYPIPKLPRPYPLRFRTGYQPHTKPGSLYSNDFAGKSTGPWVSPYQVMHPGIEARDFSGQILEWISREFLELLVRRLGHELEAWLKRTRDKGRQPYYPTGADWWKQELRRRSAELYKTAQ